MKVLYIGQTLTYLPDGFSERCAHLPHIEQIVGTYEMVEEFLGL